MLKPLVPTGVKVEHKYDFICDIPSALKLVIEQEQDTDAVVLNCVNALLDFVTTSLFDLSEEYRILRALADRLTFRGDFGEFKQTRVLVRNALLWCAGIVSIDLILIQSLSDFEALVPGLSAAVNR